VFLGRNFPRWELLGGDQNGDHPLLPKRRHVLAAGGVGKGGKGGAKTNGKKDLFQSEIS